MSHSTIEQETETSSLNRLVILQLLSYSANALSKPYINLYLVAVGVSASRVGLLLSVGALVEMLLPPLLNAAADRTASHRRLFIGFLATMAFANLIFASLNQFWALALATVLIEASFRPSLTLGMQLVITRMEHEGRMIVGRIRAFSSLGFGLSSFLVSGIFALGGYIGLFVSAALAYVASIGMTGSLPRATTDQSDPLVPPPAPTLSRSRGFYILVASMFFLMMGNRAGHAFWFVHFQENLGVTTNELGRIAAIMALLEIPFFLLLDRALRRFDVRLMFIVGGVAMAAIWFAVAALPSSIWIYPLMVFRAAAYATLNLATFMVIVRVSIPANVATNQAILQGTIPSLAALLTGSISGWLYEFTGASTMFMVAGVTSLIGIGLVVLGYRFIDRP